MINSISSSSNYWYTQTKNSTVSQLLAAATATTKDDSTVLTVASTESSESSDSSDSESTNLSMEDLLGMMQSSRRLKSISTEEEDSSDSGDISAIDADGDGTISTDEYEAMIAQMGLSDAATADEFFAQYDTNEDGEISSAEMDAKDATRPMMPPPMPPSEEEEELSSAIDTDGDGTISADEYDALLAQLGIDDAASADEFFAQYDTNSDGEITIAEMEEAQTNTMIMPPMGPPPESLPSDIDLDEDGSLSTDEYESMISQYGVDNAASTEDFFDLYDTNEDGEISADEIAAMKDETTESLSAQLETFAANTIRAYETSFQYMYNEEVINLNNIA